MFQLKVRSYGICPSPYHLTLVRMAIINKSTNNVLERMWRKGNPSALLVGTQTGAATVENSMEFSQTTKNGAAVWSLSLIHI